MDNKSAITVAEGMGLIGNLKHMERRQAWLHYRVKRGKFSLQYIPTAEQPADFLTKVLHYPAFNRCSVAIGQVRLADVGDGDNDVQHVNAAGECQRELCVGPDLAWAEPALWSGVRGAADLQQWASWLTRRHLGYNLLYGRISTFVSNITPLTAIATLCGPSCLPHLHMQPPSLLFQHATHPPLPSLLTNLNFNYLYDSVPSTLLSMASLIEMRLSGNYLTGTLPAVPTKLKYLAVNHNFLAGAFPSQAFQFCDMRSNCFSSPGTCTNANGVAQRTSGCAICATNNAAPPLCSGIACILNASAPLAAGTVNNLTAVLQPFYCGPATIDATAVRLAPFTQLSLHHPPYAPHPSLTSSFLLFPLGCVRAAQALLVLRAALGVTQSNWLVDLPCDIADNPAMPSSWVGVGCDTTGQVVSLSVLRPLHGVPCMHAHVHGVLLMLGEHTEDGEFSSLKTLNVASNFLAGTFPASSTTMCDARNICLVDASKCVSSGSSTQRASTACTTCGLAAFAVLCGGGVCAANTDSVLPSKTPNSATAAVRPLPPPSASSLCLLSVSPPCSSSLCLLPMPPLPLHPLSCCPAYCALCQLHVKLLTPTPLLSASLHCCTPLRTFPFAVSILANLKTTLGVLHQGPQGIVVDLFLKQRLMRGIMHPHVSKFTALTALDLSNNFLSGPLHPFVLPLTGLTTLGSMYVPPPPAPPVSLLLLPASTPSPPLLSPSPASLPLPLFSPLPPLLSPLPTSLHPRIFSPPSALLSPFASSLSNTSHRVMSFNFFSGSVPAAVTTIKALTLLSLGWNYLTGTLPVLGTALKVLDTEYNYLTGIFPSATWVLCSARSNCYKDASGCKANNNAGTVQRASYAICGSADGTGVLCGSTVPCQPDPTAVKASTVLPSPTMPQLSVGCPPVPPVTTDATAGTNRTAPRACLHSGAAQCTGMAAQCTLMPLTWHSCISLAHYMGSGNGISMLPMCMLTPLIAACPYACTCFSSSLLPMCMPTPLINVLPTCTTAPITTVGTDEHQGSASALMNVKAALGVTYTNWALSSTCTALGSTGGSGFMGVQCNSLGSPVKISLKSNLLNKRLEEFASLIPSLPNLAVV
ncbi:unnamed protein product [Closterium sp. NIES-65]|nr:unnamed protein product [Closterium sp. NIES-65]